MTHVVKQYTRIISLKGKQRQWPQALDAFEDLRQRKIACDVVVFNATINACSSSASWFLALGLLDDMQLSRVSPDIATYNTTIKACAHAQHWHHGMHVLEQLKCSNIGMDAITCSALIKMNGTDRWHYSVELLEQMHRSRVLANNITYSVAIAVLGKAREWENALAILRNMKSLTMAADRITYSSLISACERGNQWSGALELLGELRDSNIVADVFTYSAAISACEEGAHWVGALQLLTDMRRSEVAADTIAYNASISACEKQHQWEIALELFAEMRVHRVDADVVTHNATISALGNGRQWERAVAMLQGMKASKVLSNSITYGAIISACESGKQWALALNALRTMENVRIQSNTICYYAAMNACGTSYQWELASVLLEEMLDTDVVDCANVRVPYVHKYQAGSILDCFKHVVLVTLLQLLARDVAPFTYVDMHAGGCIYDLHSDEAAKVRRFETGISLLRENVSELRSKPPNQALPPSAISLYLSMLSACNETLSGSESSLYYLGSPGLAQHFLRPQDKAVLFEKAFSVHDDLKQSLSALDPHGHNAVEVIHGDSYRWLLKKQHSHRFTGRGLVLLDPPYDSYDSYTTWNLFMLKHIRATWPASCIALWYPCRDASEYTGFIHRVQGLQLGAVLAAELRTAVSNESLQNSGMLLVNPPTKTKSQLECVLPILADLLSPAPGTRVTTSLQWIS